MKKTLPFLKRIKKNNNTPWMHEHKAEYLSAKKEVEFLAQEIAYRLNEFDPRMPLHEPKDCMFRFNRDIRFSDNKKPYKENFGVYFSYGSKQSDLPGYYLNISPTELFVAGGLWMPGPPTLLKLRRFITNEGDALLRVIDDKKFKTLFGVLSEENKLKRVPKDFSPDQAFAELLKYKSFTVSMPLAVTEVTKPGFAKKVVEQFKHMKPLNDFLLRGLRS